MHIGYEILSNSLNKNPTSKVLNMISLLFNCENKPGELEFTNLKNSEHPYIKTLSITLLFDKFWFSYFVPHKKFPYLKNYFQETDITLEVEKLLGVDKVLLKKITWTTIINRMRYLHCMHYHSTHFDKSTKNPMKLSFFTSSLICMLQHQHLVCLISVM